MTEFTQPMRLFFLMMALFVAVTGAVEGSLPLTIFGSVLVVFWVTFIVRASFGDTP